MSNNLPEEPGLTLKLMLRIAAILGGTVLSMVPTVPESQATWDVKYG